MRAGDETAFGQLWARHESAARRLARQISNPSNADDLVSEAFYRVLKAMKAGNGPDGAFRPYLFSTLRRINIDNGRSYYTRVSLTDDDTDLDLDHADSASDVLMENVESSAAWRAWNSLPDSTRTLLWHLVIEEETPSQIAPLIGTTANGVSSRAVRAKERLRQAFLQQHLLGAETEACRRSRGRLGEYVRDALSVRDRTEVQAHLDTCELCQQALFEVTDINQTMRVVIAPFILGGAIAAGHYLAATSSAAAIAKTSPWHHFPKHQLTSKPMVVSGVAAVVIAASVGTAFAIHAANVAHNQVKTIAGPTVHPSPRPITQSSPTAVIIPPVRSSTPSPTPDPSASATPPTTSPPTVLPTLLPTRPTKALPVLPSAPRPTVAKPIRPITTVDVQVITTAESPAPTLATLHVTVPPNETSSDTWTILSISDQGDGAVCTIDPSGSTAQCSLDNPPAGPHDFIVVTKGPANPSTADRLAASYGDSNIPATPDSRTYYTLYGA